MSGWPAAFRVTYRRYSELRDDVAHQMARGGLLVKVHDATDLTLDAPVQLELVLPDGASLQVAGNVLQVLEGFGVAVSVAPDLVDRARRAAAGVDPCDAGPARHERLSASAPDRARPTPAPPEPPAARAPAPAPGSETPSRAEKIQLALHGNRDERNAILRDRDRTLHPFVLKNPQLNADDVIAIAKNAQVTPELLKLIGERKEWLGRPAIALALARNPKTPPELAVRAIEHLPPEAVRQIAKGAGVLPHVSQAARRKLLG